jgi:hypothetical protein
MRIGGALFLWVWILTTTAACGTKGPSMWIDNPTRDVGTLIQGETIRQVFGITNKGSATLEISNVAHS